MRIAKSVLAMVLALVLAVSFIGCTKKETDTVAATVNGTNIYESDITARIETFRLDTSSEETKPMEDTTWAKQLQSYGYTPESLREYVIRYQFGVYLLFLQRAADAGITPDAEKIDQSISDAKSGAEAAGKTWDEYLKAAGFATEASYRTLLEAQSVAQELLDTALGDLTPSKEELDKYISENAADFAGKRFSLIYLPYTAPSDASGGGEEPSTGSDGASGGEEPGTGSDGTEDNGTDTGTNTETPSPDPATPEDENSQANILAKAQEALGKIKGGTDFSTIASEYSQDTSTATQGGDYGWGATSSMPVEVQLALATLGINEVSDPVLCESYNAYFILKVTDEFNLPTPEDETTDAADGTGDASAADTANAADEGTTPQNEGTDATEGTNAGDTAEGTGDATETPAGETPAEETPTDETPAEPVKPTVDPSLVPASLVEMLTQRYTETKTTEAQNAYFTELVESDEIVINAMPEGLPYAVDMSLADAPDETTTDDPNEQSTDTGELVKTDTLEGTGVEAKTGDKVQVHYIGYMSDGSVFESSYDSGQPIELTIGAGTVIQGWEQGLPGMKVGGKRTLVIPPSLAYGATGQGSIPPNATLTFALELVSVNGDSTGYTPEVSEGTTGEGTSTE